MGNVCTYSGKEREEDEAGDRKDQDCNRRDVDLLVLVACRSTVSKLEAAAGEMGGEGGHVSRRNRKGTRTIVYAQR